MMQAIVLLGCPNHECETFGHHAVEFGWRTESAATMQDLRELSKIRNLIAIFFDAQAMGLTWDQALNSVRNIAPAALPIACHKFSGVFPWPELAEAGAFHAV